LQNISKIFLRTSYAVIRKIGSGGNCEIERTSAESEMNEVKAKIIRLMGKNCEKYYF
jgi:hypothetical protein